MNLTASQFEKLLSALLFAFPSIEELERFARFRLDKNIHEIGHGNLNNYGYKLVQWAESQGKIEQLIRGARQSNPGNPDLFEIASELQLTYINVPTRPQLQLIIRDTNSFLNINEWRINLAKIEFQVCRVEIKMSNHQLSCGTGFLIGPDTLITNYHVMEPVLRAEELKSQNHAWAAADDVILRFDFKLVGENNTQNDGTVYRLAPDDWLIDSSPTSELDQNPVDGNLPSEEHLDYALLKIDGEPGNEPIGTMEPGGSKRGWIKVQQNSYDFPPDSAVIIVQHPKASPLKLAIETQSIIGLNGNGTRVKYRTNTEPGSSGSPCFSINWELIALHHLGDPDYSQINNPYNQGIPFSAIYALLEKRGLVAQIPN